MYDMNVYFVVKMSTILIGFFWIIALNNTSYYRAEDFYNVPKIDAHVHIFTDDHSFVNQAIKDNFKVLSICLDNTEDQTTPIKKQFQTIQSHKEQNPDTIFMITSFSMENWDNENWTHDTIEWLDKCLAQGAIAVKLWKNIGMSFKDKDGSYVMIDNLRFDPVFKFLESRNIPIVMHISDRAPYWERVKNEQYLKDHPQDRYFLEIPAYKTIINSRERVLERYPNISFVGCHFGSMIHDLDMIGKTLNRFSNFAVDMAWRVQDMRKYSLTDREKVRNFFITYQDRILYGTDFMDSLYYENQLVQMSVDETHNRWFTDWIFFVTDEEYGENMTKNPFKGLKLPRTVVDKIYRANAEKWYNL